MTRLVCPEVLIDRLEGRSLCVRVDSPDRIVEAADRARRRSPWTCVICDSAVPLDEINPEETWRGIAIALMAPSIGRFRNLASRLELLRGLGLRVFLPGEGENLAAARLLASVGISVTVTFDGSADWEALADLMTYALIGPVRHAPVEPFETMAACYRSAARGEDWGRAWFDDPSRYLHLDAAGRVALTRRELLDGRFVADGISNLDSDEVKEAVEARNQAWRELFAQDHVCARCASWRICGARFAAGAPDGCAAFFDETTQIIERRRRTGPARSWQP